jgi:hypothetical protein
MADELGIIHAESAGFGPSSSCAFCRLSLCFLLYVESVSWACSCSDLRDRSSTGPLL